MHRSLERQARRFAYQWFRQHHEQASEQESHNFAAGRWQEFLAQAEEALPEDEPAKLVDWCDNSPPSTCARAPWEEI